MEFSSLILWALVFLFFVWLANSFARKHNIKRSDWILLFLYHCLFNLIYIWYASIYPSDSIGYYYPPSSKIISPEIGPGSIYFIVGHLKLVGVDFYLSTFIFSFIGFFAIYRLYAFVKNNYGRVTGRNELPVLYKLLFYIPSVHFWTSGISKDALVLFALILLIESLHYRTVVNFIMAFILMLIIRPYFLPMIILGYVLGVLTYTSVSNRIVSLKMRDLLVLPVVLFLLLYFSFVGFVSVNVLNIESLQTLIENRSTYGNTASGIDTSISMLPLNFVYYNFRPLFFDAHNLLSLIASGENIVILFAFVRGLFMLMSNLYVNIFPARLAFISFFIAITSTFVLAALSYNEGIVFRQRIFTLSMFLLAFLSAPHFYEQCKNK